MTMSMDSDTVSRATTMSDTSTIPRNNNRNRRSRRGIRRSSSGRTMISSSSRSRAIIASSMTTTILLHLLILLIQRTQRASCFSSSSSSSSKRHPPPPSPQPQPPSFPRGRSRVVGRGYVRLPRRTAVAGHRRIRLDDDDDDDARILSSSRLRARSEREEEDEGGEGEEGKIGTIRKKEGEESRIAMLRDRRRTIRGTLKAAEVTRNFRLDRMMGSDEPTTGSSSSSSDARYAVNVAAFAVAAGAVLLRFGGRAALVSAIGLDFATDNPELKDGLESVLRYASTLGIVGELALFVLAWTAVKVLCFDAGGVILALSSGILFGGVFEGALISSFAATVGSSVAFALAKLDTPVRTKALEVVEKYPSLRGIEKVVARDGLKAILTLRLAPVLPIPIGLYNYVYGVTNVPYPQFAMGIFLGSLKPYLLDSYLGVFGKDIVDGNAGSGGGMEDTLLLIALGASVLIGVFASQLANQTWDSINEEIEIEKAAMCDDDEEEEDVVVREFMGVGLPQWIVGFQLSLMAANKRVNAMIEDEYRAKVWNCTMEAIESSNDDIIDPASQPGSPEIVGADTGFDFGASICDGLVLSPALFGAYLKYADPLYVEGEESRAVPMEISTTNESEVDGVVLDHIGEIVAPPGVAATMSSERANLSGPSRQQKMSHAAAADDLLTALVALRVRLQREIDTL